MRTVRYTSGVILEVHSAVRSAAILAILDMANNGVKWKVMIPQIIKSASYPKPHELLSQ